MERVTIFLLIDITQHSLISYLTSKSFHYTGTLQTNHKNFPDNIKLQKGRRMKHLQRNYRSESGILLVKWQDKKAKKPVVAISTKFVKNIVAVSSHHRGVREIPEIIHRYNLSMNGCDRLDQSVSYYSNIDRKTVKWWKRIF